MDTAAFHSDARLQQVVDHSPSLFFAKDPDGRYLLVNQRFLELCGRTLEQVVGRTDRELFPPDLARLFRQNDLRVLVERQALEIEETAEFGGARRTFLAVKFPLLDDSGMPYAVCGIATDITERKRVAEALERAALAVSSAEGDAAQRDLVRALAATLDADCAFVALPPKDDNGQLTMIACFLDGQVLENHPYEFRGTPCELVLRDGPQVYADDLPQLFPVATEFSSVGLRSYAGRPIQDATGRVLGLIAVASRQPIANVAVVEAVLRIFAVRATAELERARAYSALRHSEASYRAIFEASEDAIFVHDWDTGAIVDANPRACAAYGYTHAELLRVRAGDLSSGEPPYTEVEAARLIERCKREGSARTEWRRRNRDGSLHWDEVFLKRVRIDGRLRVLAFTREITERKLAEDELRRSEDRLRATFGAALDCIVVMDAGGAVVEMNPAAESCLGHRRDDVLGQQLADMMIPDRWRAHHRRGMEQYLATGEGPYLGRRIETTAVRADGTEFPVELAIGVAEGADGKNFIGYLRDITERKEAEERRNRLESQLRQAQKMEAIGQLTGGIAHDFNNLLTSIMGYVVLALERQEPLGDARLAGFLDEAKRGCERARDLIRQMLQFSRGQKGDLRPVQLATVVRDMLPMIRTAVPASIDLALQADAGLPQVLADPLQVDQVLLNLCINAGDAQQGAGPVRIEVQGRRALSGVCSSCRTAFSGDYVALCVVDCGTGIPAEVMPRIFDPFFSTKAPGRGAGMGLAMVHGLVHELQGHVVVDTRSGNGTRFEILLPALREELQPVSAPLLAAASRQTRDQPLGGSVLVVDDDSAVGRYMKDLLETWGARADHLEDPERALEMLTRDGCAYDVVITDFAMPALSGLALAAELRRRSAVVPVLMYTGFGEHVTPAELTAAGVDTLLRKPVEPAEPWDALRRLLPAKPDVAPNT